MTTILAFIAGGVAGIALCIADDAFDLQGRVIAIWRRIQARTRR